MTEKVALGKCTTYDTDEIYKLLRFQFESLGIEDCRFAGKKVAVKPNLVRKMDSSLGGTTHPSFVEAVSRILKEAGAAEIVVAESPAGVYSESALRAAYKVCGISDAAERAGISLNYGTGSAICKFEGGKVLQNFDIIDPIRGADVIINLCKLKSHGLTAMSAAVKNYFGTISGVEKFEMHARFPDMDNFCSMLVDLCRMYSENKYTVNIVDGIVGMEGNGPTNGEPRRMDLVVTSENAFAADLVCAKLIGLEGGVKTVLISEERGYCSLGGLETVGESIESMKVAGFDIPDTKKPPRFSAVSFLADTRIMRMFEPRPVIDKAKCIGCGECVRSCPKHTIKMSGTKKRRAEIARSGCIKCYCCQELCPRDAVRIRRSLVTKMLT